MYDEAKSKVTRRDFLKEVGSGAIGAAIVSAGVLNPDAVESAPAPRPSIPHGIGDSHKADIRGHLKQLLIDPVLKAANVVHVNLRLNESAIDKPVPFFIDWVGTPKAEEILGEQGFVLATKGHRFKDAIRSVVYDEVVGETPKIAERNWCELDKLKEKKKDSQLLGPRAGAMYQMSIGIVAKPAKPEDGPQRCVGLITAGFPARLVGATRDQVIATMKAWAGWQVAARKLDVVNYIGEKFTLGGPLVTTLPK